jgi:hypothetical protein
LPRFLSSVFCFGHLQNREVAKQRTDRERKKKESGVKPPHSKDWTEL